MCLECFNQRLLLYSCPEHELAPTGLDIQKFDYDLVQEYLAWDRAKKAPFDWCSVCPSAAFYKCVTESEEAGIECGCGLRLCEECAALMTSQFDGDLMDMVAGRIANAEELEDLRADAELLENEYFVNRF